jgi:hypothetical protein
MMSIYDSQFFDNELDHEDIAKDSKTLNPKDNRHVDI